MTTTCGNVHQDIRRSEMIAQAFVRMYAPLCGYVAKRIGSPADVEDLVQDTFESLMKPGLMLSEQSLTKFIYSIAHNHIIDYLRRHACSIRAQEYFFAHSPLAADDADLQVQAADVMDIEDAVLKETGEKGRTIYMMFVHRGCSAKEIAEDMGLSERTVENHIFRTRNKVRESLRRAL